MIIKLHNPLLAFQPAKGVKIPSKKAHLSYAERVKADRMATALIMSVLMLASILYSIF